METLQKKWVMACIDGSALSDAVVDYAAWIAEKVQSPLELMHTIEHGMLLDKVNRSARHTPNMRENLMEELSEQERAESKRLIAQGKQMLEAQTQRLSSKTLKDIAVKQRHGELAEALEGVVDEIRVLVIGQRGEDHVDEETAIGSQLESSIRALHKPILIVNADFKQPKSMMLAYNDTEGANKALNMVCKSPLYRDMQIHLVHVSDKPDAQALLDQAAELLKQAGLSYQAALLNGDAQTELLKYQDENNLDMTVMGAFSHGKLRNLFFGSFTLKMLEQNHKPVLLLR